VFSGNQGGKTHIGSVESALYALGEHPNKRIRTPNIGWIVTAKKLEEGIENDVLPKLLSVVGSKDIKAIKNDKQGKPYKIIWRSDSVSYFKSAEQKDMTFEGTTLDWAWLDEPSRREIYIAISRGLMKSGGHLWYTCTLIDEPWLHEEIYTKGMDPNNPDYEVFEGSTDENITLSEEGKKRFFDKLTPDEIQTRRYGKSSHLSGRVFKTYDQSVHRITPFDIPSHWPVYLSIDPHRNKPMAVLFLAVAPNGNRYICNEIYVKCTPKELAGYIKDISSQYNIVQRLIDTSAQEEGWGKYSCREMLYEEGVDTKLAQKRNLKAGGIVAINQGFQSNNLFVFDHCVRTHKELTHQIYKKLKNSSGKSEEPQKTMDDMTDNLRYILVEKPEYEWKAPIHEIGPIYVRG